MISRRISNRLIRLFSTSSSSSSSSSPPSSSQPGFPHRSTRSADPSADSPSHARPRPIFMPNGSSENNSRFDGPEATLEELDDFLDRAKPKPRPLAEPGSFADYDYVAPEVLKYLQTVEVEVPVKPQLPQQGPKPKLRTRGEPTQLVPLPDRLTPLQLQKFLALRAIDPDVWTPEALAKGFQVSVKKAEAICNSLTAPILQEDMQTRSKNPVAGPNIPRLPPGFGPRTTIQGEQFIAKFAPLVKK